MERERRERGKRERKKRERKERGGIACKLELRTQSWMMKTYAVPFVPVTLDPNDIYLINTTLDL